MRMKIQWCENLLWNLHECSLLLDTRPRLQTSLYWRAPVCCVANICSHLCGYRRMWMNLQWSLDDVEALNQCHEMFLLPLKRLSYKFCYRCVGRIFWGCGMGVRKISPRGGGKPKISRHKKKIYRYIKMIKSTKMEKFSWASATKRVFHVSQVNFETSRYRSVK